VVLFPPSKLSGPVKTSLSDDFILLESGSSVKVPLIGACLGLALFSLAFFSASPVLPVACGLVCILFSAELLLRPHILISPSSRSIQILAWSWLRFRRVMKEEISFAEIREVLVEAEFQLGFEEHPVVWHLVTLSGENHRTDVAWHFQREPTMKVANHLAELTGKPITVENDPTNSSRWASWAYNFLR
jgi:hypothetical protein